MLDFSILFEEWELKREKTLSAGINKKIILVKLK
jgi:hypothetical protein